MTIPDSAVKIGLNPFCGCEKLTAIHVSDNHPVLISIDGVLFTKENQSLICYPMAKPDADYSIPHGTSAIEAKAFIFCSNLETVTIPKSVNRIGGIAFFECNRLTNVIIPSSVVSIGDQAFGACENLTISVDHSSYAEQYGEEYGLNILFSVDIDY